MSHLIYTKLGSDIRLCHVADELKTRGIEASAKIRDGGTIFYVPHKSFRGIFFTIEKDEKYDGYFKLNSGANRTDLVLFANLLDAFRITHGAKLFDEDEDYQGFDNPMEKFSEKWIDETLGHDIGFLQTIVKQSSVQLFGVNRLVSIGPWLFEQAGVSDEKSDVENADLALDYMAKLQWLPGDDVSTISRLRIDMDGELASVSAYMYSDKTQGANYNYTFDAKVFCIYDIDKKQVVFLDYKHLPEIVPSSWERMDQTQYHIKPLTREEFNQMFERAKEYQIKIQKGLKKLGEADDNYTDSPLVNYLSENADNDIQTLEVKLTIPDEEKEADTPKTAPLGKGALALIIVSVIAAIYISTKGFLATLFAFLFCILVIVGLLAYGKMKNKKNS